MGIGVTYAKVMFCPDISRVDGYKGLIIIYFN